jgi:hypothetical protein
MSIADLKLKIFREVDALPKDDLEEVYGLLTNYLRGQQDMNDWHQLPEDQKQGILEAIAEVEKGNGQPHATVMANIREKYA